MRILFLLFSAFIYFLVYCHTVNNPIITDYIYHDSSLIEYNGEFYSFVSCLYPRDKDENIPYYGISIFKSSDLCEWTYYKQALSLDYEYLSNKYDKYKGDLPFEDSNGEFKLYPVWAPEIIKYKDKYLLFLALRRSIQDTKIVVFQSTSPDKDFEFLSVVVSNDPNDGFAYFDSKEQIDPNPIITNDKIYLIFGSFGRWTNGKLISSGDSRGVFIVELDPDNFFHMKSQPTFLTDYYEGVIILERGGNFYLLGSNGSIFDNTYQISYAISPNVMGPYYNEDGYSIADRDVIHFGTTILKTTPEMRFNGFGCPSQPIIDRNDRYWMMALGHMPSLPPIISGDSSTSQRYTFLLELKWDKNNLPYFDIESIQNNVQPLPSF